MWVKTQQALTLFTLYINIRCHLGTIAWVYNIVFISVFFYTQRQKNLIAGSSFSFNHFVLPYIKPTAPVLKYVS